MIKKNFKYLLLSVIGFMILTINVNALTCTGGLSCTEDPSNKQWKFSYGNQELFCVSKSFGAPTNIAKNCSVEPIRVNESKAFKEATYFAKRDALRKAIQVAGIYKGTSLGSINDLGISVKYSAAVKISQGGVSYNGTTATVDIITTSSEDFTLRTNKGSFANGSNSIELKKGTQTTKLTVTSAKLASDTCEPVEVTLTANYNKTTNPDSGSDTLSGTNWYYVNCPGKVQDYMFEATAGIPWSREITDDDDETGVPYSVKEKISIMPNTDACDCGGESNTFCVDCQEDATAHDTQKNLLTCANANAFTSYCGTKGDIRKPEMIENPYCDVYCTEEISYSLPGKVKTQAGRYYKLMKHWDIANVINGNDTNNGEPITMTGKRTCITSKVDKDKYVKDVKEVQESVIDKYNEYLYYKNGAEAVKNATTSSECSQMGTVDVNILGKVTKIPACVGCTYTKHTAKKDYNKKTGKYSNATGAFEGTTDSAASYTDEWYTDTSGTGCEAFSKNKPTLSEAELTAKAKAALAGGESIQKDIKEIVDTYKKCTDGKGWQNNYCFKPEAHFSYDEPYNDVMEGDLPVNYGDVEKGGFESSDTISDPSTYTLGAPKSHSTNTNYVNIKGENLAGNPYTINPMIQYAKQVSTASAKFETATKKVVTYRPHGTIEAKDSCGTNDKNCKELGYVFPVALERVTTLNEQSIPIIGEYKIEFKNVGTSGSDTCDATNLGRISDPNCSLSARESGGCPTDYSCKPEVTPPCPNCKVKCTCPPNEPKCKVIDNICVWEDLDCPTCKVHCDTCIWENGDTTIAYKPISLNKVFNKDSSGKTVEKVGSNWSTPEAQNVVSEIEKRGETIYDTTYIESDKGKKSYYLIEITPDVGAKIRAYNAKSAGYTDDSLNCVNNFCESYFLRNFLKNQNAVKKAPFIK